MIKGWHDTKTGVEVQPTSISNEANISYDGLLAKCGADQVFLHYGVGSNEFWANVHTQKMQKTSRGWEKTVRLPDRQYQICFKDSANNWDNNNGYNWVVSQE